MTVFGTRPECIKMAPLVRAIGSDDDLRQTVCVTAQHREMLDQVLELFEIEPDIDLDLMTHDQTLEELTGRILTSVGEVLREVEPDAVVVQGDTTTTFATALASFYQQIPVGHVEAGLRTGDRFQPWPEELNRKMTGSLANIHFPPTETSRNNLLKENVDEGSVHVTGNTVIDALLWVRDRVTDTSPEALPQFLAQNTEEEPPPPELIEFLKAKRGEGRPLILVTGHRRENHGEGFRQIIEALKELAKRYPEGRVVYPVHLNPNVLDPVQNALSGVENIDLISPVDYAPFVYLMNESTVILTDSGGIQEEAPSLGKPVFVMRETTERPEAIDAGVANLVGADADQIVESVTRVLDDKTEYEAMAKTANPFGDGEASERIVKHLKSSLL
jgi:UDP-N-acetylglucosamine 2-epimerase (non-hydrolysing)